MKYISPIITILALLLSSTGCLPAGRCPFPGIPARASARNEYSRSEVVWKAGTYFTEGDRIQYECQEGWQIPMSEQRSIQCQKDGTWSADIPRCDRVSDWIPEACNSHSSSQWSVTYPTNTSYEITQITIKPCPGSQTSSDVTVVLDGLECARIGSYLIFNCQNVTQDVTSERIVKMNFSRHVFRPILSTLLNEDNGPLDVQTTSMYDRACGELILPESAIILRDEGRTITLGCSGPLQVSGSESITCDVTDGTWKPQVGTEWPKCVPVEPQLEEPPLTQQLQKDETWMWIVIGICGVGVVFSLIGFLWYLVLGCIVYLLIGI